MPPHIPPKSPALRDEPFVVGSPAYTKTPTPAIADRAPEREPSTKRRRNSSDLEPSSPSSARRLASSSGSRNVDVFIEKAGITPDSGGNTYNSNTFNFNHITNQFQKNISQYAESKEEAETKIRNLEATIENITTTIQAPQDE